MHETSTGLSTKAQSIGRERRVSGPAKPGRGVDAGELATRELNSLTALARRYSFNSDDADEAVQRGLEILLRRAESLERDTAASWLRTVVKHEAFAVRAERLKVAATDPDDLGLYEDQRDVVDTADLMDRLSLASEAMSLLKPREAEALLLQAEGLTYKDIASEKGWTYTKVNRLINEGAKAFRGRVDAIESGLVCADVTRSASGEISAPHRRHLLRCSACRAEFRDARGGMVMPVVALPVLLQIPLKVFRAGRQAFASLSDRFVGSAVRAQSAVEALSTGKVVAVAASAAALAGGGVAVTHSHGGNAKGNRAAVTESRPAEVVSGPVPVTNPDAPTTKADGSVSERATQKATTIEAKDAPDSEFGPGGVDVPTAHAASSSTRSVGASARSTAQPVPEFGP